MARVRKRFRYGRSSDSSVPGARTHTQRKLRGLRDVSLRHSTVLLRLLLATALGALVGLEREYRREPAGLRMNILIALGAALFSVLSTQFGAPDGASDRIAAQVVTGIGFLGAGAILRSGESIHGLTTLALLPLFERMFGRPGGSSVS